MPTASAPAASNRSRRCESPAPPGVAMCSETPAVRARTSETAAWLRLSFEQLGASAFHLLARIGTPEVIFSATAKQLSGSVPQAIAQRLSQPPPPDMAQRVSDTLTWAEACGHTLLVLTDPDYPQHLLTIGDPPLVLYVDGDPACLARPGLAIVGARNATAQGIENARAFAYALACRGLCIVSGMALGIDGAAHVGALTAAAEGGTTVAVMGTGMSVIYPRRHQALAEQIRQHGALVSELPLEAGPLKSHFPRRNRLVAGLSSGVLVVEAARGSGSLITARIANDTGREVFAMPGSIHSPLSRGCHDLIRQGAKLVECAHDVMIELAPDPMSAPDPEMSAFIEPAQQHTPTDARERIDRAMGYTPTHIDTLCQHTGIALPAIAECLLIGELAGTILRLPDGLYQRIKRSKKMATASVYDVVHRT